MSLAVSETYFINLKILKNEYRNLHNTGITVYFFGDEESDDKFYKYYAHYPHPNNSLQNY